MPSNKLFLLDAMALIYRAHFAFSKNPRINSKGFSTGAVLGFTNTLLEVLRKEKPTHIGVAFDPPGPTFRHEEYVEYKAQRQETPEDIRMSIPIVKQLVQAFNIPILEVKGYEADDVIGTIAKKASKEDFEVFMMTPDKDYAQLVEDHIFLYKPAYMGNAVDVLGINEVLAKFDLDRVDQVIDYLGLMGDASDNIPGIPGVGPKTAVKYLKKYGSVEGLLENTHELKGKAKEKVEANKDQALLSKRLATIALDVPIAFDGEDLKLIPLNKEAVAEIFDEMEFRTLKRRVLGEDAPAAPTANTPVPPAPAAPSAGGQMDMFSQPQAKPQSQPAQMGLFDAAPKPKASPKQTEAPNANPLEGHAVVAEKSSFEQSKKNYHMVSTAEERQSLCEYLLQQDEVCFDTETSSLDPLKAQLCGISFAYQANEAYYVHIPDETPELAQTVVEDFRAVFEHEQITKIGQNLKYDMLVLEKYNLQLKGSLFDTMIAHYLLSPDGKHGMDVMAENYLNYSPISFKSLTGKEKDKAKDGLFYKVPVDKRVNYAAEDADITLQLKQYFAPKLAEVASEDLMNGLEMPLLKVLEEMERNGVKINTDALADLSEELGAESKQIEDKIYAMAGKEFNIASPKQLGIILFDEMKLVDKPKKTKTGQYATGEEILSKLAKEHEICALILAFRELNKLKSTYVDALPELIAEDGLIHTSYRQAVAATGRLSSTNPNLQNIPIRTARGKEIRKAFVPRHEDHLILAIDYSQIELRIMAGFAQDQHMIQAFKNGEDIHRATAAKVFKVTPEEVDSDMRRKAKTANFGIIYGISAFGLSERLNIPRGEASDIIKAYFEEFPAVKAYMDRVVNEAREQGYVETIMKRRRYLRDINSRNATVRGFAERNAINAPIQGSAADIIKKAMINIAAWMRSENLQSKMIMQVHDELVFDVHKEELEKVKEKVTELMENAIEFEVPLLVEAGVGENWLQAH